MYMMFFNQKLSYLFLIQTSIRKHTNLISNMIPCSYIMGEGYLVFLFIRVLSGELFALRLYGLRLILVRFSIVRGFRLWIGRVLQFWRRGLVGLSSLRG